MSSPRVIGLLGAVVLSALALAGCALSGPKTDPSTNVTTAAEMTSLRPPPAVSLDDGWRYYADPHDVGVTQGWSGGPRAGTGAPVSVPNTFNPNVVRAQDAGRVGWYALRFTAPAAQEGRSWALRFEQVRRTADVWLNGRKLGSADNTYAPFTLPAPRCERALRTCSWFASRTPRGPDRSRRTGGTGAGSSATSRSRRSAG